jgi:hypothetical protein
MVGAGSVDEVILACGIAGIDGIAESPVGVTGRDA